MMLVKTTVGPSRIHGIGIFAAQFIPKGTPTWRFEPGFDLEITPERFAALPETARAQVLNYAYRDEKTGNYVLCGDDARFYNHSSDPACGPLPDNPDLCVAYRDIEEGEEMLTDYGDFDADATRKLRA